MFTAIVPQSGLTGYRLLQQLESGEKTRLAQDAAFKRDLEYFKENIASVESAADLVADRRLLNVALTAFGLESEINNRAFIRKVLDEGIESSDAFANKLSDKRWYKLAEAFNFNAESSLDKSISKVKYALDVALTQNPDIVSTSDRLYAQKHIDEISTNEELVSDRRMMNIMLSAYGLGEEGYTSMFVEAALNDELTDAYAEVELQNDDRWVSLRDVLPPDDETSGFASFQYDVEKRLMEGFLVRGLDYGRTTTTTTTTTTTVEGTDGQQLLAGALSGEIMTAGAPTPGAVETSSAVAASNGGTGDDFIRLDETSTNANIKGKDGNDTVLGSDGDDKINGDGGDDFIIGGAGDDNLQGNDGNDAIYGGAGNDDISGGAGDDYLNGGLGDDVIDGGDGNDTILFGQGADTVTGGTGNDRFILGELSGNVITLSDFDVAANAGDDNDILDLSMVLPDGVTADNIDDYVRLEGFWSSPLDELLGGAPDYWTVQIDTSGTGSDWVDAVNIAGDAVDHDLASLLAAGGIALPGDAGSAGEPTDPLPGSSTTTTTTTTTTLYEEPAVRDSISQYDLEYFRENMPEVSSIDDFVSDTRLMGIALKAYGIRAGWGTTGYFPDPEMVRTALEQGTSDPDAFVNRMGDNRMVAFVEAFNASLPSPPMEDEAFLDEITRRFTEQTYQASVGEMDNDLRIALNFRDTISETLASSNTERGKWLQIMGSDAIRGVVDAAFNLPSEFAQLDLDTQVDRLMARSQQLFGSSSATVFEDSDNVDRAISRYLLQQSLSAELNSTVPGYAAVQLLSGAYSSSY
ncbi:MAG: DUF1217 domain-containing protein [Neomegalonema sp.]|nr:DUF1217 domain-containing protein [Neomegalonema sp.]